MTLARSTYYYRKLFHSIKCFSTYNQTLYQESNTKIPTGSTVDSGEVYIHTQQKDIWWNLTGPMRGLHSLNILRVPLVRDGLVDTSKVSNLSNCLEGKKILEVGCGGGVFTEGIARFGADVTGIDASNELIELAKYHGGTNPKIRNNLPKYLCTTIEEHCRSMPNHYDAVVATQVLEHVLNPESFIEACVHATKPGGRVFITVPNRTRMCQFIGIFMFERILKIAPKGIHQFEKFVRPLELKYMLELNNCSVELTRGMIWEFWIESWLWSDITTFNYAMQAVKLG